MTGHDGPDRIGRYSLVRRLGAGGMGAVYEARDPDDGAPVAIKVMLRPDAEAASERFEREAWALVRLRHPGIVSILDVGWHEGQRFIVMSHVDGASLREVLAERGPLPVERAAQIVAAVARAVQHSHDNGVLHRDIKPANVLIERAGDRPLLTDFGLAGGAPFGALTQQGEVIGTPSFLAPEQTEGSAGGIDARADVYGLGALLYALLTGRPPFEGAGVYETLTAVLTRPPTPPRELRDGLDPALEAICLRCLQKEPARRFESAAELARALDAWLGGSGGATAASAPRASRRGSPVAIALVGALGALGAWAASSGGSRVDPPPPVATPRPPLTSPAPPQTASAAETEPREGTGRGRLAWTRLNPERRPSPRFSIHASFAYDPDRRVGVLYGGEAASGPGRELWEWDGSRWDSRLRIERTHGAAVAWDPASGRLIIHGGWLEGGSRDTDAMLAWNGEELTPIELGAHRPSPRFWHSAATSRRRGSVLLYGGVTRNAEAVLDVEPHADRKRRGDATLGGLWEWRDGQFILHDPSGSPGPREAPGLVWDDRRDRLVLFGGARGEQPDLWEWDGERWHPIAIPDGRPKPASREDTHLVFDGERVILYGGHRFERGVRVSFDDTWAWDGAGWERIEGEAPPARFRGGFIWDLERDVGVLFGGTPEWTSASRNDTWVLSRD